MKLVPATLLTGAGLAAYAFYEPFRYRLTTKDVPLHAGAPALRVLHLSDMHMRAGDRKLVAWLKALPDVLGEPPDLILSTGDMIEENAGIDLLLEALTPLEARLGRLYVLGSHDYYVSAFKAYTKYFDADKSPVKTRPADTMRLEKGLRSKGWIPLANTTHVMETTHGRLRLAGVDDPYLKRHRTEHIERCNDEVLAIGLVHAPDVVSEWILAGFDLVVAGHTHGGQVRLPGIGALVTNCSLPNALAGGLTPIGAGWLHVSPGLGAGKYSPIRFACRPEATLLELAPGSCSA
ncbi:MAG: metallophosphoesterase [Actinomycetota bacterium]